jgi:hypothetical protein
MIRTTYLVLKEVSADLIFDLAGGLNGVINDKVDMVTSGAHHVTQH